MVAGGAILAAGAFAVLTPAMLGHGHSSSGLPLQPMVTAGLMLVFPVLMFVVGRAMWRYQPWGRPGGIVVAIGMIVVLGVAAWLVLGDSSPLNGPVSTGADDPFAADKAGLVLTVLLFPLFLFAGSPVAVLVITAAIALWPLLVLLLLGSKRGKEAFSGPVPAAEPDSTSVSNGA
ncbi:MAG TPA: hypothetical protein VG734_22925 [Lacunisphaera sp.]|nr:hypothetical protein [Lacunisphaera sp.]